MSFDPNTEENRLRKQNNEIKRIREETSFLSSNINEGSGGSFLGTKTGYSGLDSGSTGDDPIEAISAWGESAVSGAIEIGSSLVKVVRDAINDLPSLAEIDLFKGSQVEGRVFYMKPKANEQIVIHGTDPLTNDSTDGNILTDDDIVITDRQIAKFRFQKDVLYKDGGGGWILESKSDATGGGTGTPTGTITSWKNPARVRGNGTIDIIPDTVEFDGYLIKLTALIWGTDITGTGDLVEGDRVLLTGMSQGELNGIWEITDQVISVPVFGDHNRVKRPSDFDADVDVFGETFIAINDGTDRNKAYHLTNLPPITLGSPQPIGGTAQVWIEFGAVGSGALPAGTQENQHLEWEDTLKIWQARTNLEFGPTAPHGDAGFLRFANDALVISGRDVGNTGNMELKLNNLNIIDWAMTGGDPIKWRLRAIDVLGGNPDASFQIQQNPDDGTETFLTIMQFPKTLHVFRDGNEIFEFNEFDNVDHKGNIIFNPSVLLFRDFSAGIGKDIARFETIDFNGFSDGLHYDIENTAGVHEFRIGGIGNIFAKWVVTDTSNITYIPIQFADGTTPAFASTNPFIYRSKDDVNQFYGLTFQNGLEGSFGGQYGAMYFIDRTGGRIGDTDGTRIKFDFDTHKNEFLKANNGLYVKTNLSDIDSIALLPVGSDLIDSFTPIASVTNFILSQVNHTTSGLSIGILDDTGNPLDFEKMRWTKDVTHSFPATFNFHGGNLVSTGDITPLFAGIEDIGTFDNRYQDIFASQSVFTPFVGETLAHMEFTDGAGFGTMKAEILGQGTFTVNINSDDFIQVSTGFTVFLNAMILQSVDNNLNYFQLQEKFADPIAGTDSGKLFAKEQDDVGIEIHPWWIGENMAEAVDLMSFNITDDVDFNCNNIGAVDTIIFCTPVQLISSVSTGLEYSVSSNQSHLFHSSLGNEVMEIFSNRVDFKDHFLDDVNNIRFESFGLNKSILSSVNDLIYGVPTAGDHVFTIDGTPWVTIGNNGSQDLISMTRFLELNNNTIQGVNDIFFENPNTSFETFFGGLIYSVPLVEAHVFVVAGDTKMSMFGNATVWENIQIYGNHYHDYDKRSAPSSAVDGTRRLFVNQDNQDQLSVIRSDGTIISLETQGAGGSGSDVATEIDLGSTLSGAIDVDMSLGNKFFGILTGSVTISFINTPPVLGTYQMCILELKQDAGGGNTVAFADTFENDHTPVVGLESNEYNVWSFFASNRGVGEPIFSFNTFQVITLEYELSDELTALVADAVVPAKTRRAPVNFIATSVRASLTTAGAGGGNVTIDIKDSGSSMLSTLITLANGITTSSNGVIGSSPEVSTDAELTFFITTVDGSNVATGAKATIVGYIA